MITRSDDWRLAKDAFGTALDLPPEQRADFLAKACAHTPAVLAEVQALLAEYDQVSRFLEEPLQLGGPSAEANANFLHTNECPQCFLCVNGETLNCPNDGTRLKFAFPGDQVIDRKYLIERRLGRGGMGIVYLARHLGLDRQFALKLMTNALGTQDLFLLRFEREAKALGKLRHPSIVEVTDYGVDNRDGALPYLVMEYLLGTTLEELIASEKRLPPEKCLALLEMIAEGIDYAHSQGVLHGDLKPANIFLLTREANQIPLVKILDFGLSGWNNPQMETIEKRTLSEEILARRSLFSMPAFSGTSPESSHKVLLGTPAYMAPELFSGANVSRATDIYALGVIAYRLFSGQLPFGSLPEEVRMRQDAAKVSLQSLTGPLLSHGLNEALLASLNQDPHRRPATANDAMRSIRANYDGSRRRIHRNANLFLTALVLLGLVLFIEIPSKPKGWKHAPDRAQNDSSSLVHIKPEEQNGALTGSQSDPKPPIRLNSAERKQASKDFKNDPGPLGATTFCTQTSAPATAITIRDSPPYDAFIAAYSVIQHFSSVSPGKGPCSFGPPLSDIVLNARLKTTGLAIDTSGNLYVAAGQGPTNYKTTTILKIEPPYHAAPTIFYDGGKNLTSLAIHGHSLYAADFAAGKILLFDLRNGGSSVNTFATLPGVFGIFAAGEDDLFVTSNGGFTGTENGVGFNDVRHVTRSAMTIIATGLSYPEGISSDGKYIYVGAGVAVFTIPTAGGTPAFYATNLAGHQMHIWGGGGYIAASMPPHGEVMKFPIKRR